MPRHLTTTQGAHFGKPGQLYYPEALEWLRKQILGKYVYCQLLRRDQYGRVVFTFFFSSRECAHHNVN